MRFKMSEKYKLPIIQLIQEHTINNPIKMKQIASRYSINDRVVRDVIHELRLEGNPICGDGSGYFWPKYKSEWDRTAQRLGSFVKNLKEAIDGGDSFYNKDGQEALF
tara:strand:+ start:537 stop:857 length:321 start_codon:yes stop_codon:yes gene_type:complete